MEIGLVGKPNVGKSTTFAALTLVDVEIAPYPFTTVTPNRGVAYVRAKCPHEEIGGDCSPGNAACRDGVRWIPVNVIDVPGLVPGAHEGKGLGHQFLDSLRAAEGFLHVVDLSGGTTDEGVLADPGAADPAREAAWLEDELVFWVDGVLERNFDREARTAEREGRPVDSWIAERLTGLSVPPSAVVGALRDAPVDRLHPSRWTPDDRRRVARAILRASKPRLIAANKCDRADRAAADRLAEQLSPLPVVPMSAEAELTLRKAARLGLVRYRPGDPTFTVVDPSRLSPPQAKALDGLRGRLEPWNGTGVQRALESLVYDGLHRIVVYPVEDEQRWTDSRGRRLPDAHLVPAGIDARTLAYRVHTDLGEGFIRAIDGRTHRALAADHPLEPNAVVRIVSRR